MSYYSQTSVSVSIVRQPSGKDTQKSGFSTIKQGISDSISIGNQSNNFQSSFKRKLSNNGKY